jgi:hypothetical protein
MRLSRIDREYATVQVMLRLYCHRRHGTSGEDLCLGCREILDYVSGRTKACRFGEDKPACGKCPIQCYAPPMRSSVREVMRYSGPRMLWRHPYLALRHLADARK